MKWILHWPLAVALLGVLIHAQPAAAAPTFPLRASDSGRHLVDARGEPFFYHADTAWNLPKKLTLAEANEYLDDRIARGFTAIQIQAISKEQGPVTNRDGQPPFDPPDDLLKPNERYWKHLDRVLDAARQRGLLVAVAPVWIRWGGQDKEGWRNQLTDDNARPYGRFLGSRYKRFDNILWILGGDADPKEKAPAIHELAAGLKDTAPHHLLTAHNAPEHASAEFFADARWLDVNLAYSYREVQPHVLAEYTRGRARPIVLGESGYEEESNDRRGGDAYRMRRQAYGALLSGACGHAFGQKHVWRFDAEWRQALDSPATRHMAHLKTLFATLPWHRLVPDANGELVVEGRGKAGGVDYVCAARGDDGTLALVYLPQRRRVVLDASKLAKGASARWFDPTSGRSTEAVREDVGGRWRFEPPEKNAAGDGDFVLVIKNAAAARAEFPGDQWEAVSPAQVGLDARRLDPARDYALTGGGAGVVVRAGRVALAWGDTKQRFDLKSTTKSFGASALGVAIADGTVRLDDKAVDHHPKLGVPPDDNRSTGWIGEITLAHLANQTAGFEKPGGYGRLLFRPGTKWHYSDAGPNWLAECLTLRYRRDLRDVMFEKVFAPIGITPEDLTWRDNQYRPHLIDGISRREFGSGISANVEAMARLGYLYLRGGRWRDRQILPRDFVEAVGRPPGRSVGLPEHEPQGEHGNASDHYGLLWWSNADGALPLPVPRDAYWSWGLYDSLIVVIPSLDIVVARAGKSWDRKAGGGHYDVLRPFLESICGAVIDRAGAARPAAPSRRIPRIEWAPPETIVRRANGSDNWPMTWADDGELYTAYGDGWGFDPRVPEKLSLGFARVSGSPDNFTGHNIRSPTGESTGDGPRGRKASGMVMADGVLYVWARNAGNAQLGWSTDHAATWTWADWKLDRGFGCPTFIQFGRNYSGATDGYVYTVSPHADDAYKPADSFDLARVPKDGITRRDAWEFFAGLGSDGLPRWTKDVNGRTPVLEKRGKCSRSGVTFVPALERYLWVVTLPAARGGPEGRWSGLSVYEAPQPWGPWTNVFEADPWDVHPGDSASFPAKWVAPDGRSAHLVFSGDDSFSVRRASFVLADVPHSQPP